MATVPLCVASNTWQSIRARWATTGSQKPTRPDPGVRTTGTTAAVEFINSGSITVPSSCAIGYSETHRVFPEPSEEEDERYTLPPAPLPDTPETRYDMASYKRMAKILDDQVGIILHALEEAGLAEDTLFIYTTDHGLAFPAMKCTLTDHGIGVSLIVRGPHGFRRRQSRGRHGFPHRHLPDPVRVAGCRAAAMAPGAICCPPGSRYGG